MATVIDALIMTLGLDTKDYDKGQKTVGEGLEKTKKHSNAVAKEMFEGGKKAATFFGSIKSELISLLAVAAAGKGLTSFLHDSIGGMAELGRQAANLSMAPKELDAWGAAAETVGGSADATLASIKGLAAGIQTFGSTGASPMLGILRTLGVQPTTAGGRVKAYGAIMEELADKFKTMTAQQSLFYGKQFGFDEGTIQLLRQGGPAVKALVDQMSRLSGVTDAGVASAQRNQAEWARIRMHFKGIRETLSAELDPALEKIANRVLTWMDANHKLIATKIISFVEGLANFVMKLIDWLDKADTATDGWSTKLLVAVAALRLLTGAGIIGGLASLAGGLINVTGAAVALAAAVGTLIGLGIHKLVEGTGVGDWIERKTAEVMASLGNSEAQQAIIRDNWSKKSATEKQSMVGAYMQLNASQKTVYDKAAPELSRLLHDYAGPRSVLNQPSASLPSDADLGDASPTKSRSFESNAELFTALEKHGNLPAGLLQRMFMQESGGGKNLLSPAGAKGPFQFMDATAAEAGLQGNDVYDLDKSAAAAAGYLVKLRGMFGGDITKAVAAYNAGPGNVRKYGGTPPFAETQAYVASIMQGTRPDSRSTRSIAGASNTSTSETKIGSIVVNTQATDAKGIVSDMRQELSRNVLIASANMGPS